MDFIAHHHINRRRAKESVALHVPSLTLQQGMPRSENCREVRHGGAVDDAASATWGQTEHVGGPAERHLLQQSTWSRANAHARVLIPGAD